MRALLGLAPVLALAVAAALRRFPGGRRTVSAETEDEEDDGDGGGGGVGDCCC